MPLLNVASLKNKFASRSRSYEVGWFKTARYPNGTPVAFIAAIHEFGWGHQTEKAFMRKTNLSFALRAPASPDEARQRLRREVVAQGLVRTGRMRDSIGIREVRQ